MATTRDKQEQLASLEEQRLWAPCRAACPVHVNVPSYLSAIADGRFSDALAIVLERNPLPSVCGRVCLRPCEEGCRRCLLDDPVAIAQLKRAAADYGVYPSPRRARSRSERIAIVGSGPTGLTAAHDLAQLGYPVTLYEQKDKLGGMLRYAIPNYRLPDYALDRDIDYILSMGVDVKTGVHVGRDISLEDLADANEAVLVTVGLQGGQALKIPGADLAQVLSALPFLEQVACGESVELGERVAVIGGGDVAMDAARCAQRMGAGEVTIYYRRSEQEMPARSEDVQEAREEGIGFEMLCSPVKILERGGQVAGIVATRMELGPPDESGRRSPVCVEGSDFEIECDTVIFAVGQSANLDDLGLNLTGRGVLDVDPLTFRTSMDRVYAAGDAVSGPTSVINAIAAGHRAAALIVRDVSRDASVVELLDEENAFLGEVPPTMASKLETRRRVQMEKLEPYESVDSFDEVEFGYTEYEAAREAQRCLSCATGARLSREKCASCLTCMRICPHGAPSIRRDGYLYFDADACHACGACASLCPAQAIALEGHSEAEMAQRVRHALTDAAPDSTLMFACGSTPILPHVATGDIRSLTVPCLLRVSEQTVLEALQAGAKRVVFAGCVESTCRFPHARPLVRQLAARISGLLTELDMSDAFFLPEYDDSLDWHLR